MTKIFILGTSQSGKTTLAKRICQELSLQHISASIWVRRYFKEGACIDAMTSFATDQLKLNPYACIEALQETYDLSLPSVIEGIRNPFDFAQLFDPRTDRVIWINYRNNRLQPTQFEKGLEVVDQLLSWMIDNHMFSAAQLLSLDFEHFDEMTPAALEFVRREL